MLRFKNKLPMCSYNTITGGINHIDRQENNHIPMQNKTSPVPIWQACLYSRFEIE